uniref:Putative secreted protein n=1 Tax=Anopheles marajoara TaxID=58244 RepID=A0A2M4CEB3_9DIPT
MHTATMDTTLTTAVAAATAAATAARATATLRTRTERGKVVCRGSGRHGGWILVEKCTMGRQPIARLLEVF